MHEMKMINVPSSVVYVCGEISEVFKLMKGKPNMKDFTERSGTRSCSRCAF